MSEESAEQKDQLNLDSAESTDKSTPGWQFLTLAVIYPLFVIGFELATNMCAESFFDPMPTLYHKLLVLVVPCANFLVWWKLRYGSTIKTGTLLLLIASSIGIAGYYTIIFLPIIPLSLIAIVFFGLGLLPFAPLISLICASKLYRNLKGKSEQDIAGKNYMLKGVSLALLTLILLDVPSAVTYFGVNWAANDQADRRDKAIQLLRVLGDRDLLLRLSYDGSRRATGLLSFAILTMGDNDSISSTKTREIFYQVTGEPFNIHPLPYSGRSWSRFDDLRFDADQGGTEVGGRLKGLELVSSRLDGSISGDDGVAYLEWIFEFKNSSFRQREARVQIALPPESVISRATLWVNGEEREAAFAGRTKARQAYQSIVRARRDPLLVTTSGTDRILAQAFPIAPRGGTIKFRVGITVPMELRNLEQASFVLPAIVDRNFSIGENIKHAIWFESKQPIISNLSNIDNQSVTSELYRISGSVSDKELSTTRKVLTSKRDVTIKQRIAQYADNEKVAQKIVYAPTKLNDALLVVIDKSVKVGPHIEEIINSLEHIPEGKRVGMIVASEEKHSVEIIEWSEAQKEKIVNLLRKLDFVGGEDNAPALAEGIKLLEKYTSAELLWIHAPQPILFEGTAAVLEQATNRLIRVPDISLYSIQPGPNKLLDDSQWGLASRTIPRIGTVEADLERYFGVVYSTASRPTFQRAIEEINGAFTPGSLHIARLWAKDQVYSLLENGDKNGAINLAAKYQLVTAVSGAVVLENQQQYKDNDLTPVGENTVPTIPEPHQWILAFIMVIFILWFLKQNKFALTRQI